MSTSKNSGTQSNAVMSEEELQRLVSFFQVLMEIDKKNHRKPCKKEICFCKP